jgi:hypothetical protein
MNTLAKLIVLAGLLVGTAAAQDQPTAPGWIDRLTVTASGTASWVENLSRTSFEPTRKDAATYDLSLGASLHQQLAPAWLLHAGADAIFFAAPDYDLTNYFKFSPRLGVQRKFGLGPLAPVVALETTLPYKSARLGADSGWGADVTLRLTKRFIPEFKAGLVAQWLEHNARSATFDLNQHSLSIEATWDINEHWSLTGSAGRLSGDIVANAAWPIWAQAISGGFGPVVFDYYTSRPWEVTNLYGDGWVSYNVEADVDLWSLAATYTISDHTSAELRYNSAFVVNKIGVRYPTDSWGLGVVHRF